MLDYSSIAIRDKGITFIVMFGSSGQSIIRWDVACLGWFRGFVRAKFECIFNVLFEVFKELNSKLKAEE